VGVHWRATSISKDEHEHSHNTGAPTAITSLVSDTRSDDSTFEAAADEYLHAYLVVLVTVYTCWRSSITTDSSGNSRKLRDYRSMSAQADRGFNRGGGRLERASLGHRSD
jgi:hypothetical protein